MYMYVYIYIYVYIYTHICTFFIPHNRGHSASLLTVDIKKKSAYYCIDCVIDYKADFSEFARKLALYDSASLLTVEISQKSSCYQISRVK